MVVKTVLILQAAGLEKMHRVKIHCNYLNPLFKFSREKQIIARMTRLAKVSNKSIYKSFFFFPRNPENKEIAQKDLE